MKRIILVLLLIGFLAVPAIGAEQLPEAPAGQLPEAPVEHPLEMLDRIINVLFAVLVIVAVIFIILGAFTLLTAQGDEDKINKGRTQILYALIAVVVAIAARGLVDWIRGVF